MGRIIYAESGMVPDLRAVRSAELVFSGDALGSCRETRIVSGVSSGMEILKRWISSASFSVIVLSGFTPVAQDVKENAVYWVSDHIAEPDGPLLVVVSSGPWKEGVSCSGSGDLANYLTNIK